MTDNLLTEEARAWIGMELDVGCVPLTRTELQRFLVGIGQAPVADDDTDPAIPPMIYQALSRLPAATQSLTKDGMTQDRRPPIGQGRGMNAGIELEFHRQLRLGDRLHGRRKLVSLEPKQGKRNPMVISTWLTEFRDADGELVIVETARQVLF